MASNPSDLHLVPEPHTMGSYRPEIPGPQREEFRRYLEKTGVLAAISNAYAHLLEEEELVTDPVHYVAKRLMGKEKGPIEMTSVRFEKETLQRKLADLKIENKNLNDQMKAAEAEELALESNAGGSEEETAGEL